MTKRVEVEVEIDPSGQLTVKVRGKKGRGCVDIQRAIEAALGPSVEEKLTAEYYEVEESAHRTVTAKK